MDQAVSASVPTGRWTASASTQAEASRCAWASADSAVSAAPSPADGAVAGAATGVRKRCTPHSAASSPRVNSSGNTISCTTMSLMPMSRSAFCHCQRVTSHTIVAITNPKPSAFKILAMP